MKDQFLYELMKHSSRKFHRQKKQRWMKNFKLFSGIAVLGILLFCGLAMWSSVAVWNGIANSVNHEAIQEGVGKGQEGIKRILSQPITTKNCLDAMGGMLSPVRIITEPLGESFKSIREACWDEPKAGVDRKELN